MFEPKVTRRNVLGTAMAAACGMRCRRQSSAAPPLARRGQALISITFDLEMSRHYPRRGMLEWDYQKGNLDEATKEYSLRAAEFVRQQGGVIHFFCVGRVLEQPDVSWLKSLAEAGHPIGNHTYDHVNVTARTPEETQFRFQRAPWLVAGQSVEEIVRENIRVTNLALRHRVGIEANGFRAPGGFPSGLDAMPEIRAMLLDLGFDWVSSKYPAFDSGKPDQPPTNDVYDAIVASQAAAQPYVYPEGLVEIPMSPISDVNAFRSLNWELEWFLEAVRRNVEQAIETGSVFDFLCHPSCLVVEDPQLQTLHTICRLVKQAGSAARLVGLDAVAAAARSASAP